MEYITILLVEDNPLDIRLTQEMLKEIRSFNYSLLTSETLKEACELIAKNKIDIILLDLTLPDSMGKTTFDKVMNTAINVPIVLVSGLTDIELSIALIRVCI